MKDVHVWICGGDHVITVEVDPSNTRMPGKDKCKCGYPYHYLGIQTIGIDQCSRCGNSIDKKFWLNVECPICNNPLYPPKEPRET